MVGYAMTGLLGTGDNVLGTGWFSKMSILYGYSFMAPAIDG